MKNEQTSESDEELQQNNTKIHTETVGESMKGIVLSRLAHVRHGADRAVRCLIAMIARVGTATALLVGATDRRTK
jgi:hypothetical protein